MSQNAAAVHAGGQGSVSVAELLARYDQTVIDRAGRHPAHRAAAIGGGSAVLLALVAGAVTLSGQQPDAGQPATALPIPDHSSGSAFSLVDPVVAPTARPDGVQPPAPGPGDGGQHAPGQAVPVGEARVGEVGDGETQAAATEQPPAATTQPGRAGEPAARAGEAAARDSAGGASASPMQHEPAQESTAADDESSEDSGLLAPVTDLVSEVTGSLPTS
jgi:hypothetical protein